MKVRHKKENNRREHHNKLWYFLVLGILVFSFSCKHYPKEEAKEKEKKLYSVSFSSQNEEFGNVKAKIKGGYEISSPSEVADGSVIIFIAEPKPRCEVVSWQGVELSEPKALQFEVKVNKNIALSAEFFLKDFVKIKQHENGIIGREASYQLAGQDGIWKGVFVKDRVVKLDDYSISRYELTYSIWKEVYDWAITGEGKTKGYEFEKGDIGYKGSSNGAGSDEMPVTMVNWYDAIIWCNAYTEKLLGTSHCVYRKDDDDSSIIRKISEFKADTLTIPQMKKNLKLKGFRIPTEAEWEYACRYQGDDKENAEDYGGFYLTRLNSSSGAKKPDGFKGLTLPDGETWESLKDEASRLSVYSLYWNGTNFVNLEPKTLGTSEVGKREPNHLGLYDMSGNVLEWCFDWFSENAIRSDDLYKVDGKVVNPLGAINGYNRVRCGGSWGSTAHTTSCGYRVFFKPEARLKYNGMRLVISY